MSTTYGYRISELRDQLAQLPAAADDRVNQAFVDLISRYADLRQRALDDLVDFTTKASATNLDTPSKWQARVSRLRSDYSDLFGSSVRDLKLPTGHQLFWTTTFQNEEKFFDALAKVGTPQLMDRLLKHQDDLNKLIGALQDSWTFLLSKNQGIQNDEMRALQDMDKMVQEIINELDSAARAALDNAAKTVEAIKRQAEEMKKAIVEKLGRGAEVVGTAYEFLKAYVIDHFKPEGMPSEADEPMKVVLEQAELMLEAFVEKNHKYREALASYKDLVSLQKGSVLTMFNKTRDDVASYLNANNVGVARTWLDQAKGQLNDWTSSLPTSGQNNDARAFRDDICKQLDSTWKITEGLDNNFRGKFQGVFLSPLSNETVENLAQSYFFREQLGRIKDRDVIRKLEEVRDRLPEKMKDIEESVRSMDDPISVLPSEIQDLARSRNKDFQEFVHDRIRRQIELLLPAIDDFKKLLSPSNLDADFGRQELENMLR